MEKINFGYSVKNIPLNNERNYKLRLIEKIEAVIKRIRRKATFYDACNERAHKEEVEDKVETYGLKSKFQNSMPSVFCSGLKGRRPFWLLNPPSRGGS